VNVILGFSKSHGAKRFPWTVFLLIYFCQVNYLEIFAVENFDRGKAPGSERRIGVRRSAPVLSALCVTGIGLANTNERWEQVADTVVPRMKHLQSDT
jgi:hypothetical protein